MKVLILGASGAIGYPTAQAFSRAGHIVYGQSRSQQTADVKFAAEEILPVVCDPHTDHGKEIWAKVASDVDVVIDLIQATGPEQALATFDTYLSAIGDRPKVGSKSTYVYAAGHWLLSRGHGGLDKWTDERQPSTGNNKATAWREQVITKVLSNSDINGIVVHPEVVYGRAGSFFGMFVFEAAYAAARTGSGVFDVLLPEPSPRFGTIHQDDLGELFVAVAERAPILRGQVLVAGGDRTESLKDIIEAVVRVSGCKGYHAQLPSGDNLYGTAWISTTQLKPSLATALTGWHARKLGMVDGMDVYWGSFLASKKTA